MEEGNKRQVTHKVTVQVCYFRYKQLDNRLTMFLLNIAMSVVFDVHRIMFQTLVDQ